MLCKYCNSVESKYAWCMPCYILYKRIKKYGFEFLFLDSTTNEYKATGSDTRFIKLLT